MQFRQFLIFFFFSILKFSYLTFSKKEFYKIRSTFIQRIAEQQRNKPHIVEEVFSETFLLSLAHCSVFWMSDRPQIIYGNHLPSRFRWSVRGKRVVLLSRSESPLPCAVQRGAASPPQASRHRHRTGACPGKGNDHSLAPSFLTSPRLPTSQCNGFQGSHPVYCSQLIRASRTPRLLSQAIGKSFCNPAFELRGYCRLQWVY